jgi:hypothetical protein
MKTNILDMMGIQPLCQFPEDPAAIDAAGIVHNSCYIDQAARIRSLEFSMPFSGFFCAQCLIQACGARRRRDWYSPIRRRKRTF